MVDGERLSDSAVEQRLRRLCKIRKNGGCEAGEDARKMFEMGGDDRNSLIGLFKQSGLKKAGDYFSCCIASSPKLKCSFHV